MAPDEHESKDVKINPNRSKMDQFEKNALTNQQAFKYSQNEQMDDIVKAYSKKLMEKRTRESHD